MTAQEAITKLQTFPPDATLYKEVWEHNGEGSSFSHLEEVSEINSYEKEVVII